MAVQLPKSQREISSGIADDLVRGKVVSRTTDNVKDFSVSIKNVDFAIKYYFNNVIKPRVVENGKVVDVPIIHANPERWNSIIVNGYWKDEKDKIILPIIAFKRTSITKDDNYTMDKVDANNPQLFYTVKKKWSSNNQYDSFSALSNLTPSDEYYNIVIPDYMKFNYDFIIMTETIEQMNKIIESVIYSEGSYWGEKDRFKFRSNIQNYTTNVEYGSDSNRIVKSSFSLDISGYLVPDTINKQLASQSGNVVKAFSPKKVYFGLETELTADEFNETNLAETGARSISILQPIQGGFGGIMQNTLTYLGVNISVLASSATTNTATFSNVNILPAPESSGMITSKYNFSIFINGQYINHESILSILDSGTDVIVTFDTALLGYSIDTNDLIAAIGKFQVV